MKCRKHPYELGVGVCASCLRDSLLYLIATQGGAQSPDHRRNFDPPPPFPFPRSVSPYVSHRRSIGSAPSPSSFLSLQHCRFFSTPQVGPTERSDSHGGGGGGIFRKRRTRFSFFSALFGYSRSDDIKPAKKSTTSWISALVFRKKPQSQSRSRSRSSRSKSFVQERGMSPVRDDEYDVDDDDDEDRSVCSSGYSTESSIGWRRPEPTPVRRFPPSVGRHGSRGVSGFAVCLSPLVRPTADLGITGDLRGNLSGKKQHHHHHQHQQHHHHQRHVSVGAASLVPSWSRKLAD